MKTLTVMAKAIFAVALVASLAACGKKKTSSSGTVATVNSNCQWNAQYNQYMIPGTTTTCVPVNGGGNNNGCVLVNNQWVYPNTNQLCNPGGHTQGQSCDYYSQYYSQMYGYPIYYVPVNIGGQYFCVNMNYMNQYNPGYIPGYGDDYYYDWYYQNPPYYGNSCQTQIDLGFGGGYFGICF